MLNIYDHPGVHAILEKAKGDILSLYGQPVNLKMYAVTDSEERVAYLREIICLTCDVKWEEIVDQCRKKPVATARFFYFVFAKAYLRHSSARIARDCNRDHTSVLHGLKALDGWMTYDDRIRQTYQQIKEKLFPNEVETNA